MAKLMEKLNSIESLVEKLTSQSMPSQAIPHIQPIPPPPPHRKTLPATPPPAKSKQSNRLPSTTIKKECLVPLATVLKANKHLMNSDSKMTTFALNLARDAFFGEDVMIQCTTHGYGETPGLPLAELLQLKEEVRQHYPKYWTSPQEFELKWKTCTEAISQGCKRMRTKKYKMK